MIKSHRGREARETDRDYILKPNMVQNKVNTFLVNIADLNVKKYAYLRTYLFKNKKGK